MVYSVLIVTITLVNLFYTNMQIAESLSVCAKTCQLRQCVGAKFSCHCAKKCMNVQQIYILHDKTE